MTPVVDAHQHVWDLERGEYAWLTPELGPLHRTWEQQELLPQLAAAGVDRTVLVQAEDSLGDTERMLAVADAHDVVAGVVGWVPLVDPDVAAVALERFVADPRFVGVRHLNHIEPDPDWLVREDVLAGLGLLAERGLVFEVVATVPRHLELVPQIAERHPSLAIVIDHLGKPPIAERGWQPWADLLARAAEAPNVSAKVSGLNTAASFDGWSGEDLRPYVEHALERFGAARLMFGGDWPVAVLNGDYAAVVEATRTALAGASPADRDAVMGGTAVAVYGLAAAATAPAATTSKET